MKKNILSILLLLLITINLNGQHFQRLADSLVSDFVKLNGFSGNIMVAHKGAAIYYNHFGLANVEWDIPNQFNTKFYIASISKQFAAAVILKLAEENKINIQSPIISYLPKYRKDTGSRVTVHHLLTHTSGIPNYTSIPFVWEDSLRNHYSMDEMVQKLCSGDLEFEPGKGYEYNNSGFFLLAKIIENIEGKDFKEVMEDRIFEPLGMSDSGVPSPSEAIKHLASGYYNFRGLHTKSNYTYMPNLAGAGNIYTTMSDLLKWDAALKSGEILSQKSLQLMERRYTDSNDWIAPYKNGYGYGVGISDIPLNGNSTKLIFHSGHISGYSGFFARFVKEETTVIILSNIGNISTPNMSKLSVELMRSLSDVARQGK